MIYYLVDKYHDIVQEIEVIKETRHFVVVNNPDSIMSNNRMSKDSEYGKIFPTYNEAADYLITTLGNRIFSLEIKLSQADDALVKIKKEKKERNKG